MSYEVFARKYRPQTFDDLVGQTHVSRTLKNAVEQNRLAHAYLFVGPRGTGKTSTARILARALNCSKSPKPTTQPCGECDNCREISSGNSLDVLEIDGASNNGVEQVRELRDNVRYAPAKSRFKIYIIDEVHMLSQAAFNALLKTLEEPPPHVKFIFATTEPQKVLATILSRCQRFDLHRIPINLIAQHLQLIARKEKLTLAPAAAHAIARGAEGGMRDAESMLDQLVAFCGAQIDEADVLNVFGFTSQQTVSEFIGKILRGETADALESLHQQCEAGKDMTKLISDAIAYLRDLLVFKVKPDALSDEVTSEIRAALEEQSTLLDTDRLLELIDQFAAAEGRMKWAPNKKLHFEVLIIKAIQTLNQATLDEVIENLSALGEVKPEARSKLKEQPALPSTPEPKPVLETDPGKIWEKVRTKVPPRGFLRTLVDSLTPLSLDGRSFVVGYSPEQKSSIETLITPANRKQLENSLREISGREWTLKLTARDEPASKTEEEFVKAAKPPPPIVREALEMFQGEIKQEV
ncbi:MAG: DNA polymerase III subunit gamma/tau [Verrucomicrobia bacterium]|nr:DNA polymerase III subunit gamma/tau [Verrucomicrobiota bacterium]